MILNLLRVETLKVEEMIKRSFSENAAQILLPDQQKQMIEVQFSIGSTSRYGCSISFQAQQKFAALPKLDNSRESEELRDYYDLSLRVVQQRQAILRLAVSKQQGSKTISSGRVVVLRDGVSIYTVSKDKSTTHSTFQKLFRGNLAVILKQENLAKDDDGCHPYWILALVDPATKERLQPKGELFVILTPRIQC